MTTTTKTIREVQYIGPDGQPIDYIPAENGGQFAYENHNHISDYQNHQFGDYQMYGGLQNYNRPPTPPTPSERSTSPLPSHRVPGRKLSLAHISYLDPLSLARLENEYFHDIIAQIVQRGEGAASYSQDLIILATNSSS